jgi:ABC-type amino acid transport substrate-binding protein
MTRNPAVRPVRRRARARVTLAAALALAAAATLAACARDAATGTGAVDEAEARPATGAVRATSFAAAQDTGRAAVAFFFVPSSGFAYRDDEGRLTGVTVELLRDFARYVAGTHDLDVAVAWYEEPRWADFYGYVRDSDGGVFGIGNVTITDARRDELAFSPPYLNNVAVLVTHENVPELRALDEIGDRFAGLTALPYPGTLHETRLNAIRDRFLPELDTHAVASNDELVSLIGSGDGYFGYMDVYNYWRAREAGVPLRRHAAGDDGSETFGVIMPNASDWAPVMRAFFEADGGYAHSDRFRGILRAHLGDELAGLLLDDAGPGR